MIVEPIPGRVPFWRSLIWPPKILRVAEAFSVSVGRSVLTIPKGFETDGATIPRPFRWILPPLGTYLRAVVVHDYLYTQGLFSKALADRTLRRILIEDGVSKPIASIMYLAVKLFGKGNYK